MPKRMLCLAVMLAIFSFCMPFYAFAQDKGLPRKFDPTQSGMVTAVRQSPQAYNLCWAYATVAAIEQSIVFSGLDSTSIDLSESALAYFSGQSEKYTAESEQIYNNSYITSPVFAMSRLCGIEFEADEPTYLYTPSGNPVSYSQQGLCEFELESMEKVAGDREKVKSMLMQYGGAAVCYHSDNEFFSADHKSYYQNVRSDSNHSVTVIGWDDDYSRENFGSVKPAEDGAWLCKSVWGTRNEDGYYWISYCEQELKDFYFYKVSKAVSDNVYTHNGGTDKVYVSSKAPVSAANVFVAQTEERLTEVSFFVEQNQGQGTDYTVRVFKNVGEDSPTDGIECADISGRIQYDGYYTVKMPSQIELTKGERFSVAVTLKSDNGKNYFVAEDAGCECSKGQTYFYMEQKGWQDCVDSTFKNAYINAYTQKIGKPDKSGLKQLIAESDGKKGMQRAVAYAKSVLNDQAAGCAEVNKAEKLLEAVSNECGGYKVIATPQQWNEFAKSVNNGVQYRDRTVVVEADLDFKGVEFVMAGTDEDRCFNGYFQGNGHSIKNVKINDQGNIAAGIFGYLGKYAQVCSVVVENAEISAQTAGGIVGICDGGTLTGCGFYGQLSGDECAGIIGRLENGTVSDCWSDVNAPAQGIAARYAQSGRFCVLNCYSTAADANQNVRSVKTSKELAQMLNTGGRGDVKTRRFEASGSVVRPLIVPDSANRDSDKLKRSKSGFYIVLGICAAAACCTSVATTVMIARRIKR